MDDIPAVMQRARATKPPAQAAHQPIADCVVQGLAEVFQMLADPSRLKILLALAQGGPMHVSGLCQLLGQSQPAVSHHLSLLLSRRLVSRRRDGKNRYYSLDSALLRQLLDEFFGEADNNQRQIQLDGFSLAFKCK